MARALGAQAQMALAFEIAYGKPPDSGFIKMPFVSTTLGAEQSLIDNDLIGGGRDPSPPALDTVTADGDVVAPIDTHTFPLWLKSAFGPPTTTGKGPYTHEFHSGAAKLPSLSIEVGLPEVPYYGLYSGCVADKINWRMERSGQLTATVNLVAQGESVKDQSQTGSPVSPAAGRRFGHFNGSISRDGVSLGNVVSADLTYANNLNRVETIRSDGKIEGVDPGIAALIGSIEVRFADQILLRQASKHAPCVLEFGYELPSGESLKITAHSVYLPVPRREISGPGGVQVSFDWQAARDKTLGRMCAVTLVNSSKGI
ncbi:MAG: phage tail tube protein [Hyphomicrobiales bacterium]